MADSDIDGLNEFNEKIIAEFRAKRESMTFATRIRRGTSATEVVSASLPVATALDFDRVVSHAAPSQSGENGSRTGYQEKQIQARTARASFEKDLQTGTSRIGEGDP